MADIVYPADPSVLPGETLLRAIEALRTLCEYLDRERSPLLHRFGAERRAKMRKVGKE